MGAIFSWVKDKANDCVILELCRRSL